jgi:hypothetical protein
METVRWQLAVNEPSQLRQILYRPDVGILHTCRAIPYLLITNGGGHPDEDRRRMLSDDLGQEVSYRVMGAFGSIADNPRATSLPQISSYKATPPSVNMRKSL